MEAISTRKSLHIEGLQEHFKNASAFHIEDVQAFYKGFESSVKRSTVEWRIHELRRIGVLERVGRGWYRIGQSQVFAPEPDPFFQELHQELQKAFPFLERVCYWNSKWLNDFLIHQPTKFYRYVEVPKDAMEAVFDHLKEAGQKPFFDPSKKILDRYGEGEGELIVNSLTTEAPIQNVKSIPVPTLEMLMVDLHFEGKRLGVIAEKDIQHFYERASNDFRLDRNKLLRYARRRGKKKEVEGFLERYSKKRQ